MNEKQKVYTIVRSTYKKRGFLRRSLQLWIVDIYSSYTDLALAQQRKYQLDNLWAADILKGVMKFTIIPNPFITDNNGLVDV